MQNENTLISKESPSINDERINSKENPENKIQIETLLDLYKIPINSSLILEEKVSFRPKNLSLTLS